MGTVKDLIEASREILEIPIVWPDWCEPKRKQLEDAVKQAEEEATWQEAW